MLQNEEDITHLEKLVSNTQETLKDFSRWDIQHISRDKNGETHYLTKRIS